jgi:CHAT domain-containing protein
MDGKITEPSRTRKSVKAKKTLAFDGGPLPAVVVGETADLGAGNKLESGAHQRAAWGVLVYLAGDVEEGYAGIAEDLAEIKDEGGSTHLQVVVQYDGPNGMERYHLPTPGGVVLSNERRAVDSGSAESLLDFLRWGLSVCDAERLALVIGTPTAAGMGAAQGGGVFSLLFDEHSGNRFDAADLGSVIRTALDEAQRAQLDLLAIDSCSVQFLELAYELEDLVSVLIAPQTEVPEQGWDYRRVLARWKQLATGAAGSVSAPEIAKGLVDEIVASYRGDRNFAVSALDLRQLAEVARVFDTVCIGTLQSLGEGLVWTTRDVLRGFIGLEERSEHVACRIGAGTEPGRGLHVYDCGSFFKGWEVCLKAMALEAYQGWLGKTLQRAPTPELDRFLRAVERHLRPLVAAPAKPDERLNLIVDAVRKRTALNPSAPFEDRKPLGEAILKAVRDGISDRMVFRGPKTLDAKRWKKEKKLARRRDLKVAEAICAAYHLLPEERQVDLQRMRDAARNAWRLAAKSRQAVRVLLGDTDAAIPGLVIVAKSEPAYERGWPRWSGVSLYRPDRLDDLMNAGYQRFAFHRRVHWAAMLGAANLIDEHPRALWRLVSSLLATGGAGTRRDVLRRLTGADSVVWGLRDQFQVMAPAPTVTLSLERRDTSEAVEDGREVAQRENYLLRLESINRGAVVIEQESRVQPKVLDRALHELEELLKNDTVDAAALKRLRSIGGLLGEDIFQSLGHTLDDERTRAVSESADATPHLQLQIPRELMRYPWELLHHRKEWLSERFAMGRQVFMETGMARRVPGRTQGCVRPLVIGDPLFDRDTGIELSQLPGARAEAEQIADLFERLADEPGSVIDFRRERDTRIHMRVTCADMRALLRDGGYDIVHFAGHGVFRQDDPETSAWFMSDAQLWSLEIRNTLAELDAPPWLVFANACDAGMDAGRSARKYQGNVFGLASAFINHGVAAYIAPLWPIDDMLAQYIALEFYRHLLRERATLGESLRQAKRSARRVAYPDGEDVKAAKAAPAASWAGLGWASLVLYGDPSEELFQALAGGPGAHPEKTRARHMPAADRPHGPAGRASSTAGPERFVASSAPDFLQAPDQVVSRWVRGPNWREVDLGARRRASAKAPKVRDAKAPDAQAGDRPVLELIEESGLRRWRVRTPGAGTRGAAGDGLRGSPIARLLADDRVRRALPGRRGIGRVIGRWILSGFEGGLRGLVGRYDVEQVANERLLRVHGVGAKQLEPARREHLQTGKRNRALVLVHGTFSNTASPVDGFGPDFLQWANRHYRAVLGLDHWTLSKTPEENAELLVKELRALDPDLLQRGALDVISHSRGGLVARAFSELLEQRHAVRNMIFIGTPNCGTDLANPNKWGAFADLLVNMTGLPGAELFGRLAGLLAQLVVLDLEDNVPGLLAQDPGQSEKAGSFMQRLQLERDRSGIHYGVICSEFEPTNLVPSLKQLVKAAAREGVDEVVDTLFDSANDLVVNTAHAWCIGQSPRDSRSVPKFVDRDRVLVYRPPAPSGGTAKESTSSWLPDDVVIQTAFGIHHCNLFGQPAVQESIKRWLTDA